MTNLALDFFYWEAVETLGSALAVVGEKVNPTLFNYTKESEGDLGVTEVHLLGGEFVVTLNNTKEEALETLAKALVHLQEG